MLIVVGRGEGLFKMNIKNDFYFVVYCNYMFFFLIHISFLSLVEVPMYLCTGILPELGLRKLFYKFN